MNDRLVGQQKPQRRDIQAAIALVLGAMCVLLVKSSLVPTLLASFTAATTTLAGGCSQWPALFLAITDAMDDCRHIDDVEEFLALFVRSGLTNREQCDQLLASYRSEYLPAATLPDTITCLCSFLISRDALTTWQCEKLRNGQYKGFFIDHFKLLDRLSYKGDFGYYLALDMQEGVYVKLAVTPTARKKGADIEYRVEERLD